MRAVEADTLEPLRVVECQPGLASAMRPLSDSSVHIASHLLWVGVSFALVDLTFQPELLANILSTKHDIAEAGDLDEGWRHGLPTNVFYYVKHDRGDGIARIRQRMMAINIEDPATGRGVFCACGLSSLTKGWAGREF